MSRFKSWVRPNFLLISLTFAGACGGDDGPGPASNDHDGGTKLDSGQDGDRSDGGDTTTAPPLPTPDWDAAQPLEGPPVGYSYVEKKGSFKLIEPAALASAYGVLAADTQDVRLFYNDLQSADAGAGVEYGSVFYDGSISYQYPESKGFFRIARSTEDALTYVSEPFDYVLKAWVPGPDADRGYLLQLSATQAIWAASFSADFTSIEQGRLQAAVLPSEAKSAPLALDPITCLLVCSNPTACGGGLEHLSDLLDCNGAKLKVDTNADGKADAYELRIEFTSERVGAQ
ncbi:MAG: hypothetical protein QM778_25760 [Myxococcales bacterium]